MPSEILSGMKWHSDQSCHPVLDGWKLTQTSGVGAQQILDLAATEGKIIPKRDSMKPRLCEQLGFLYNVHHFWKPLNSRRPLLWFLSALTCCTEVGLHLCSVSRTHERLQRAILRSSVSLSTEGECRRPCSCLRRGLWMLQVGPERSFKMFLW